MFLQLQSISVTISYDSSGNIDVHVPHTLVTSVCGMCSEEYVSTIVLIVCGMCSEEYVSTYCTYCMPHVQRGICEYLLYLLYASVVYN